MTWSDSPAGVVRVFLRTPLIGIATLIPLPLLLCGRGFAFLGLRGPGSALSHLAIKGWARACLRIIGVRLNQVGQPPQPPFFLVANHLSYLDIMVLHARCRGRFLSKAEIAKWPVAGPLARLAGTLFIDRERRRDVSRAIPEMRAVLEAGDGVILFPEGTSSPGSEVLPFHASLLAVPASMEMPTSYASLAYATPEGAQPAFLSVCWWGDMPFGSHFLKLLSLPSIACDLRFGHSALTGTDRKTLALDLHAAIRKQFQPTAPKGPIDPTPPNAQEARL